MMIGLQLLLCLSLLGLGYIFVGYPLLIWWRANQRLGAVFGCRHTATWTCDVAHASLLHVRDGLLDLLHC